MPAARLARLLALTLLLATPAWAAPLPAGSLQPDRLQTEFLTNPLGIDTPHPRLSWIVTSPARGQVQSAYRILVASSPDALAADQGDLWDSGQVQSSDTLAIPYAGKDLASHQYAAWKVMVWDGSGQPSAWSAPASFSIGMLKPSDWVAQWVGFDTPRSEVKSGPADFATAHWIWHAADPATKPQAARLFATTLDLPADARIQSARLLATADDAYRFTINGHLVVEGNNHKVASDTDVAQWLRPGPNTLRVEATNTSEGPAGLIARLTVNLEDGRTLESLTDTTWKTLESPGANWHDRPLDLASLPNAASVGAFGDEPWGKPAISTLLLYPPALVRTDFGVAKPVKHATLYATALGLVDLHLNGHLVGDQWFNPGWTDYNQRALYRAHDVTALLQPGPNALGAVIGDGWYSGYVGYGGRRDHYGKHPRVKVQLHLEFTDGTTDDIESDGSWNAATGPIRESDFLMGEHYDARQEIAGWSEPAFDDTAWADVNTGTDLEPSAVQWHPGPPVTAYEEFAAKSVTQPKPGTYILDLGRNFAGIPRLILRNTTPGQTITLRFAERLNPDGSIYTTNYRSARSIDTYVCKGAPVEDWAPRFTFHGFQYIEVTGLTGPPFADTVTALALSSATPIVGSFVSSDPMLNQLHSNIYYTQRSNFIEIPTDCPQRDERLGWTGDAQAYIRAAALNTDVHAFFIKWLQDLTDGQRADGQFPMVAPVKVAENDGGPAWADAGVICPWAIYQVYGDKALLERQYPSMLKFIDFCQKRSKDGLLPPDKYHCFGDWLSIKADTPVDVIYTAYYAHSTRLTAKAAEVLGKTEDAARLNKLADDITAAFVKTYVEPDGQIRGHTQTGYILPIAFGLLDPEAEKKAGEYLVADIEARGNTLSTGFVGTKDLMHALTKIGRNDVAYKLLHQTAFPSWGFSIQHGATSIWERWDGWTPEKGFQDPGMNSFAHYAFGAVYQWMVQNIAGIVPAEPGYGKITIAPTFDPNLIWADIKYDSPRGPVRSFWKRLDDGRIEFYLDIPANTAVQVVLPTGDASQITESAKPLIDAFPNTPTRGVDGKTALDLPSGAYSFTLPVVM
jgi:alpha-L-rhamnosidase